MKKVFKAILIFLGSIILLLLVALIFQNAIISYSLKTLIYNRSEGAVEFDLKDLDLNLKEGSIVILEPELKFTDVYLDSIQNVSIDRILLQSFVVDRMDLRKLFSDRNIHAIKLVADRPKFMVTERGRPFLRSICACFDAYLGQSRAQHSRGI